MIGTRNPRWVRTLLQSHAGISSLVLRGDVLRVVVDHAAQRATEFEAALRAGDAAVESIQHVAPTIEDLFVDAIGAGGAADA